MKKDLNYWKNNAEEDYLQVPISALRYITELEKQNEALVECVSELLKDLRFHGFNNSTAIYKANELLNTLNK